MDTQNRKVKIRSLDLRDGHQSYFATRMRTEQILDVLPYILDAGYFGIEMWGGATLDSCTRFLFENPWERLDKIAEMNQGKIELTALARGINLFGYNPYPDEVVYKFNKLAVESGITVMRVFDALNDLNNLKVTVEAVKDSGGKVDLAICYTTNPNYTFGEKVKYFFKHGRPPESIFDVDYFVNKAINMEKMGADIITIKDMAGLIEPKMAYDLISKLKQKVKVPINLHSHCTPGYAVTSIVAGMIAGVDIIDGCSFPFSGGPSHPSIEIINAFAKKLNIDLGLNEDVMPEIRKRLLRTRRDLRAFDKYSEYNPYFGGTFTDKEHELMDETIKHIKNKSFDNALKCVHSLESILGLPKPDDAVRKAQIPGGMYSNLLSQLEQANISHLLSNVLHEVPQVRVDAGVPPLVTPTSQIVGVQAVQNVKSKLDGKAEYSNVTKQYKMLVRGEYGETPKPISPDFREKITGSKEEKRYDTSTWEHTEAPEGLVKDIKDQMLIDLFPTTGILFLKNREKTKVIKEKENEKKKEFEKLNRALADNYLE